MFARARRRLLTTCLPALVVLAAGRPALAQPGWTDVAPPGADFSALAPGMARPNPNRPTHYEHESGDVFFFVETDDPDDIGRQMLARGDRQELSTFLGQMRDATVKALKGTAPTSSFDGFAGHPSILFSIDGVLANRAYVGRERIVFTEQAIYLVVAAGPKDVSPEADIDRFIGSFTLVTGTPLQTISFTDAVCDRIPSIPVTFDVPADFMARRVVASSEAGCLWGTKADLDLVTADPAAGDFSSLARGVFRARLSTNIVNSDETGAFDALDGSGEAGMRRSFEDAGVRIVTFKKETIAGLPALEIVVDVSPGGRNEDRVYMLYLGKTHYISNAMLVNYYHPQRRSAADDVVWARFVAGIKAAIR